MGTRLAVAAESRCSGMDFVWTDETPMDYEVWAPGEPNNFPVRGCQHWTRDTGEDCVEAWRGGQSWSDDGCRKMRAYVCQYDCDPLPPPPAPALPCTSTAGLTARINGLTDTCCPDGSCAGSLPTFCDFSCSLALLAFTADCQDFFGEVQLAQIIEPVLEVCEVTKGQGDPTEVGGDQVDHFVLVSTQSSPLEPTNKEVLPQVRDPFRSHFDANLLSSTGPPHGLQQSGTRAASHAIFDSLRR